MPLFAVYYVDKPNSREVRNANHEAHRAYVRETPDRVKLGGTLTDDEGARVGQMIIMDLADRATAEAFVENDPYTKAGLFERVEIRPFQPTIGPL